MRIFFRKVTSLFSRRPTQLRQSFDLEEALCHIRRYLLRDDGRSPSAAPSAGGTDPRSARRTSLSRDRDSGHARLRNGPCRGLFETVMLNQATNHKSHRLGSGWSNRILLAALAGIPFLTLFPFRLAFHPSLPGQTATMLSTTPWSFCPAAYLLGLAREICSHRTARAPCSWLSAACFPHSFSSASSSRSVVARSRYDIWLFLTSGPLGGMLWINLDSPCSIPINTTHSRSCTGRARLGGHPTKNSKPHSVPCC